MIAMYGEWRDLHQHYQLACVKYFEVTHGVEHADLVLQHPNQYFEKSRELRTGEKAEDEGSNTRRASTSSTTTPAASKPQVEAAMDDEVGNCLLATLLPGRVYLFACCVLLSHTSLTTRLFYCYSLTTARWQTSTSMH